MFGGVTTLRLLPVIGDRCLRVGGAAGQPGLIDQVGGSQSLCTGIVYFGEGESALLQFPRLNTGFPVAVRIVEKIDLVFGDGIRTKTAPAVYRVIDPEDPSVETQFP